MGSVLARSASFLFIKHTKGISAISTSFSLDIKVEKKPAAELIILKNL
jgi:hypothetical protein